MLECHYVEETKTYYILHEGVLKKFKDFMDAKDYIDIMVN